jgi:protein-S-isoprenylcysteine O-methyltransferase Ste14
LRNTAFSAVNKFFEIASMKKILKQFVSFILPVMVLFVIPVLIENTWNISWDSVTAAGILLALAGFGILVLAIATIIRIGRGTLAPWSPTRNLVIVGMYSHTRNPMIPGVMLFLLGESLIFHSVRIFIWLVIFFIINNIHFTVIEEPGLSKRFGDEYFEYKKNVPRWIPRLEPWKPRKGSDFSR